MQKLIYTLTALCLTFSAIGQGEIIQIDQEKGYTRTVFLNLNNLEMTSVDYTQWDIAFGTANRTTTILYNEATLSSDNSIPPELYVTSSTNFDSTDLTMVTDTLYNGDSSIGDGAFGLPADTTNPFDYGWGLYDLASHNLNGTRIFILKLRDGSYKKIRIDRLQTRSNIFYFTYADLNNENKVTDSIHMNDHAGKTLAYYSLKDQKVVDIEPDEWDLQFTRYNTPVETDEVPQGYLNYLVTGVFSRPGVEVAKVTGIDPAQVKYEDHTDKLTDAMDAIGHDWKYFDLNTFQYSVNEDEVYFVKTTDNEIYKLHFLDFEGASTGVSTLEITFVEVISSSITAPEYIKETVVFPNPVTAGQAQIRFHSQELKRDAVLTVNNSLGQEVYHHSITIQPGENTFPLPVLQTPGMYYVVLRTADGLATLPLINN